MSADWQAAGLCLLPSLAPYFGDRRPPRTSRRDHEENAKAVCRRCPVIGACLQWALEQEGTAGASGRSGVLGGLTARERAALAGADTTEHDDKE